MKTWTAEERLRLLAVLLGRKWQEAMGHAPKTPINYELLLLIAVAPAVVLNGRAGPGVPLVDELLAAMIADWAAAASNDDLFHGIVADLRRMFRPEHQPWWAKEDT